MLLAGGQNGGGGGFENGVVDAVYSLGISEALKTAPPLSTTPSKAGCRLLALDRWPKWRREVFENGVVDVVNLPRITGASNPRFRYRPPHIKGGWPMAYSWRVAEMAGCFENGAVDAVYSLGITGVPKAALPLSTAPSRAGGRWLALVGWPKWRRGFLKTGWSMR